MLGRFAQDYLVILMNVASIGCCDYCLCGASADAFAVAAVVELLAVAHAIVSRMDYTIIRMLTVVHTFMQRFSQQQPPVKIQRRPRSFITFPKILLAGDGCTVPTVCTSSSGSGSQSTQSAGPVCFFIFCSISISLLASLVAGRSPQCSAGSP